MSRAGHQSELGDMDAWQEDPSAWEEESDATWEAEEVLRYWAWTPCSINPLSPCWFNMDG